MPSICDAVRRLVERSGLSQREAAARVGTNQQTLQRWSTTQEPKLDELARIEQAFDLPRGSLLRDAGYVADVVTVEDAIRGDSQLSLTACDLLVATYRAAIRQGAEGAP